VTVASQPKSMCVRGSLLMIVGIQRACSAETGQAAQVTPVVALALAGRIGLCRIFNQALSTLRVVAINFYPHNRHAILSVDIIWKC